MLQSFTKFDTAKIYCDGLGQSYSFITFISILLSLILFYILKDYIGIHALLIAVFSEQLFIRAFIKIFLFYKYKNFIKENELLFVCFLYGGLLFGEFGNFEWMVYLMVSFSIGTMILFGFVQIKNLSSIKLS